MKPPRTAVITVEDHEALRLIGLSRPEVHNALNQRLVLDLVDALQSRPADTRCVVLFGHGASFCAGGDRREGIGGPDGNGLETLEGLQEITRQLQSPDILAIAAVEGWAIGGGAEIALACDVVVAGEGASFRFPEVELDAHPTGGSTWLLPRTVGAHRANVLLLTGAPLPAHRGQEWGLVAELTPDGGALDRARDLATDALRSPAEALRSVKRSLKQIFASPLEDALLNEVKEALPRLEAGGFLSAHVQPKDD